jgi:Protein of unknown function (DUF2889)
MGMERGSLNRVVRTSVGAGAARAVVEDDFHHFRLTLRHDGRAVTALEPETLRSPFSLCAAAGERLDQVVGAALTPLAAEVFRHTEPRLQCTHQFDLAALAIAAAARGHGRSYRVHVPDPVEGRTHASVSLDGQLAMSWDVEGYAIAGPARFAGIGLGKGFTDWVTRHLDADQAETALVLRRGVFISRGRTKRVELDRQPHAPTSGGCWVQQPERAASALRNVGSWRDFSAGAQFLTVSDEAWLAFSDGGEAPLARSDACLPE